MCSKQNSYFYLAVLRGVRGGRDHRGGRGHRGAHHDDGHHGDRRDVSYGFRRGNQFHAGHDEDHHVCFGGQGQHRCLLFLQMSYTPGLETKSLPQSSSNKVGLLPKQNSIGKHIYNILKLL